MQWHQLPDLGSFMMYALISMHMELRKSYGPEVSAILQWIRWEKLELLHRSLDIVLGSEMTKLSGCCLAGLKRILSMLFEEELSAKLSNEDATNLIQLLFASTRKVALEKIVPASDNKMEISH